MNTVRWDLAGIAAILATLTLVLASALAQSITSVEGPISAEQLKFYLIEGGLTTVLAFVTLGTIWAACVYRR